MAVTQEAISKAIEKAKQYGASKLILFGSALENMETAQDLDLACAGINDWSFFELAASLESELNIQIDLVPLDDSNFSRHISRIGKVLYEQE